MLRHITATLCALVILCLSMPASAFVISTSVGDYDVTRVNDSFINLQTTLEAQVWWGNSALAEEFAGELQGEFGAGVGSLQQLLGWADYFLYASGNDVINVSFAILATGSVSSGGFIDSANASQVRSYATARLVDTGLPEPGTLGLLLMGLTGLVFARKRNLR